MRRTGYNILGEFLTPPSGDIRPAILSHLRAYRPTVITVMDNPSFAVEALEATAGETMVIHRHYHPREDYLFSNMDAETYANYITYDRTLDKRLWPQVWNEPTTAPDRLPMLLQRTIEVADILTQWGYRGVLGNLGTATIQPETIATGVFDEYLTRLALWTMNDEHVAGYHEYTAILAPFGVGYWSVDDLRDPAKMQPDNWPEITPLDVKPFISVPPESQHYWHILRLEWLQERAELIGVGRHQYVITENFLDRMGDVSIIYPYLEQTYGVTSDWEIKGAPTLEKVWASWWPEWSRDYALAAQCWWLERNYPDECIGWTLFCFCRDAHMEDKAQRWEPGYDISDWSEFQALMVINRDTPAKPDPDPDPEPTPDPDPEPDPLTPPPTLFYLMLAVCGILVAMIIYGVFRPRPVAQGAYLMEDILNQLFAIPVFATITYTSGIVYFLTEVWKRSRQRWFNNVKWLRWAEPEVIAPLLVVLFLGLHGIAVEYAYDNVLKEIAQFVTDLIGAIGPYVLGMIGTNALVSYSYDKLQAADVPGFTYKIRKSIKSE